MPSLNLGILGYFSSFLATKLGRISLFCCVLLLVSACKRPQTCLPSAGFIAQRDTLFHCETCAHIPLQQYDTLVAQLGKCVKHPLNPPNPLVKIEEKDTVFIGVEPHTTPFYFVQADVQMGFSYELLSVLIRQLLPDINVRFKLCPYPEMSQKLLKPQPELEIMCGAYAKDTTLHGILWTESYLDVHYAMITRKADSAKYKTLADLAGKKIGVYQDKNAYKWLKKKLPTCQLYARTDDRSTEFSDWMQFLIDKEVEAIVYDYPLAFNEVGDYGGKLVISNPQLGDSHDVQHYAWGVSQGGEDFLRMLNQALFYVKKTPEYQQLLAKYIPNPALSPAENPNWNDEDKHFNPKARTDLLPPPEIDSISQ